MEVTLEGVWNREEFRCYCNIADKGAKLEFELGWL
jgi:hypothetical protein